MQFVASKWVPGDVAEVAGVLEEGVGTCGAEDVCVGMVVVSSGTLSCAIPV